MKTKEQKIEALVLSRLDKVDMDVLLELYYHDQCKYYNELSDRDLDSAYSFEFGEDNEN